MAEQKKYLDNEGLTRLVGKIKTELDKKVDEDNSAFSTLPETIVENVTATAESDKVSFEVSKEHNAGNDDGYQPETSTVDIASATTEKAGVMSAADKQKLDKAVLLDDNGLVPSSLLPSYVDDVVEFNGIIETASVEAMSTTKTSQDLLCRVVYVKSNNKFALYDGKKYYGNWGDGNTWGTAAVEGGDISLTGNVGRQPESGKIYVNNVTNKTYRWSGSELVEICSGGVALGETAETAYAGDKGAQNAKDIAAIKSGDLPLVSPVITNKWTVLCNDGSASGVSTSSGNLNTIYGYKVNFNGSMKWTHADGYKDPTSMNGGDWSNTQLPASGENSVEITKQCTTDTTITAGIKAPKQGLVLSNGIIREASSSDVDTKSVSVRVHFQYKVVLARTEEKITADNLPNFLNPTSDDYACDLKDGKNNVYTMVNAGESEYLVYAYPSKLGELSKITMNDATPLLNDGFTLSKVTITDPQTKLQLEYNVYTSVQRGAFTGAKLDIA